MMLILTELIIYNKVESLIRYYNVQINSYDAKGTVDALLLSNFCL